MTAKHVKAYLVLVILLSAVWLLLAESAMANPVGQIVPFEAAPAITINVDGSITPETGLISRNGNTYTLTGNVTNYQISILCSNIFFDGAGYTINVTAYKVLDENGYPKYVANYQSEGIRLGIDLTRNTNVTIKNVNIFADSRAIHLYESSGCRITEITSQSSIDVHGNNNNVTNCQAPISIFSGSGNIISKNNISDLYVGVPGGNQIYLNNIFVNRTHFGSANNFLDNGSVGNYWVDYTTRYPNASEIDHTGVGDTSYVVAGISINDGKPLGSNVDNHPLFYPYDLKNDYITLPALPSPTLLSAGEGVSESSVMAYVVAITLFIAAVAVGLIYYQRKRKASHV